MIMLMIRNKTTTIVSTMFYDVFYALYIQYR